MLKKSSRFSNASSTLVVTHSPHHHDDVTTIQNQIIKGQQQEVSCDCDLISIDCLDSIKCLPKDLKTQQYFVALGVLTRKLIKETVQFNNEEDNPYSDFPIGKGVQYMTISAWKSWMDGNKLPKSFDQNESSPFVNESWYPFCRKNKLKGKSCFLRNLDSDEDLDELEEHSLGNISIDMGALNEIEEDLSEFQGGNNVPRRLSAQNMPISFPALGYLMSFAHVARIRFNRQPSIQDAYRKHLKKIITSAASDDVKTAAHNGSSNTKREVKASKNNSIRVSLHIRRADACNHKMENYQSTASELNSAGQVSGKRICYDISVYMNALCRIQTLSGKLLLDVYIATDHGESILEEIRLRFPESYSQWNWYYLNYSRSIFKYKGMIEFEGNETRQILGETAVADLWHLSH